MSGRWLIGGTWRHFFEVWGGIVLHDTPGGRELLRQVVDPSLHDLIDGLERTPVAAATVLPVGTGTGGDFLAPVKAMRVRDETGRLRGTAITFKPPAGMDLMGMMPLERDLGHLERIQALTWATRRPSAILFADLESSSAIARSFFPADLFASVSAAARACICAARNIEAAMVGVDPGGLSDVQLADLDSATDKARRDTPVVAVTES